MQVWLVPVSKENWEVYRKNDFRFLAFPYRRRKTVSGISEGDHIVLYIASRLTVLGGVLLANSNLDLARLPKRKTAGARYRGKDLEWDEIYSCRIETSPEVILKENQFVDFKGLMEDLEFVQDKKNYYRYLQQSLILIPLRDYKLIR